jgi:hypothetical protein
MEFTCEILSEPGGNDVGGGMPGLVTQWPLVSRVGSRSAYRIEQEAAVVPVEQWH